MEDTQTHAMDATILEVFWSDGRPSADLLLALDATDLGTIRLAFTGYREAAREQERLSVILQPTEDERRLYRDALEAVGQSLCSLGTLLLPVAKALAGSAGGPAGPPAPGVWLFLLPGPGGRLPPRGSPGRLCRLLDSSIRSSANE